MDKTFSDYLDKIGIQNGNPFFEKVETVINFYSQLYTIQDIFITDHIDAEGNRHYNSIWLFSANETMEAKNFLSREDYDCTQIKKNVRYWQIIPNNFDFKNSSPNSKFFLKFTLSNKIGGELNATKENCIFLFNIFKKYILPNLA